MNNASEPSPSPTTADGATQLSRARSVFALLGCAQAYDASPSNVRALPWSLRTYTPGARLCGPVFSVNTENDMLPGLQALYLAPAGSVIVVNNLAPISEALAGDVFCTDALHAGMAGLVVNGAIRDIEELRRIGLPVYAREHTFVSARTAVKAARQVPEEVTIGDVTLSPGDWLVGDDDGLLAIAQRKLGPVLVGAQLVEEREAKLRAEIRSGKRLHDLCGLPDFLAGKAPLGFEP